MSHEAEKRAMGAQTHLSGRAASERAVKVPSVNMRLDARSLAAEVIARVLGDAAYGAAALHTSLERYANLDERTRAFTTELVYTTLRLQRSLLTRLEGYAPKGLPTDPLFLSHLLVAATQILALDHRTSAVAVDVAVSNIRAVRGPKMAGFANAVLRKLNANRSSFDRAAALRDACPQWLYDSFVKVVGQVEADRLLGIESGVDGDTWLQAKFPIALRVRTACDIPQWLEAGTPGRLSPLCRIVQGVGDPRKLEGYAEGRFVIQEEGAQLIALALGAKPGDRVLDACAGRGQKTTLLAEQVAPNGVVCATDLHPRKLEALQAELERLGLSGVTTASVDWSRGAGAVTEMFDKVLVDAPCTGTGTLRKRPEIGLRLKPEDPARLGELQTAILRNAAMRLRSGGTAVFAVCSVLEAEAEAVVAAVEDLLTPIPFVDDSAVSVFGEGQCMGRLLPGRHGTDGYFLAHLQRR
jgi:16S rRNA (cytosine967-C5)-methyltransferase